MARFVRLRVRELNPIFFANCVAGLGHYKLRIAGLRRFERIVRTLKEQGFCANRQAI